VSMRPRVTLLAGGGGGAKLAAGLGQLSAQYEGLVVTNVGDDFEHLGLTICPDTDSVLYALSGLIDPQRGWGRANESWRVLDELKAMNGPAWFNLGDLDIALHLHRGHWLAQGESLSAVTARLATSLGITDIAVAPATDQQLRTQVETDEGRLEFQQYFVARRCEPKVSAIEFTVAHNAQPSDALVSFSQTPIDCLVLGPSNPLLSIDPIFRVPGMLELLKKAKTRVAVCPIVGGAAIKGPLAKLMAEMNMPVSAQGWMQYMQAAYPGLIDLWVFDEQDRELEHALQSSAGGMIFLDTVMTDADKARGLASHILAQAIDHA